MTNTRVTTFPSTRLPAAEQDPAEVAAAGVRDYCNDFITAANLATTPQRALVITRLIDDLMVKLGSAQMIAFDRADRLCN